MNIHTASYPIFVMYNELQLRDMLPDTDALDIIWEHCVEEYEKFFYSDYNKPSKSEFDCITDYVKHLKQTK